MDLKRPSDPTKTDRQQFEFSFDKTSGHYKMMFGKTELVMFDWQSYYKKLRRIKQKAVQKLDFEQKPQGNSVVKTYKSEPWTTLDQYPALKNVFSERDMPWVNDTLLTMKPYDSDHIGYVYVYQRRKDIDNLAKNKITHILLHKIGLTKNSPQARVHTQELKNGESYKILKFYETRFYKYVEMVAHRFFKNQRI